jgi:hypothetical protein
MHRSTDFPMFNYVCPNRFRASFAVRSLTILAILLLAARCVAEFELPLHEGEEEVGVPWEGARGVPERIAEIMERQKEAQEERGRERKKEFVFRPLKMRDLQALPSNPNSPDVASFPRAATNGTGGATPNAPQTTGVNFLGATLEDTGAFPPDTMGAVGPAQFIVAVNGRIRSFNKQTGVADGVLNADMDVFFQSVMTPPVTNNFTSDPRIRYDRLSGRWFVIMIDVPGKAGTLPNRIMIAVSSGSVITTNTTWTFFQFQHDLVSSTGDTGKFADYPTLGVDANALYIGVNVFGTRGLGSFSDTTLFVVRKSSLLGGGPIVVTAFRDLVRRVQGTDTGPYTPQGVDNFDPAATEGYVIGVDAGLYGRLMLRRISNPAGTPSISGNISISIPLNGPTITVPHLENTGGSSGNLDGLDYRLMAAHIRNGRLWTCANMAVDNNGTRNSSATRMGVRWYELDGMATGQTPSLVQSGTVFESSPSNSTTNRYYWMGTVMVSGQGHAAMGFSVSGVNERINAATVGRLKKDPLGTMRTPLLYTASSTAYNPPGDPGGGAGRRWGDYSYTCVDPDDDMTMWTIQEFCNASNSYGCQIVKLLAPPPAIPSNCSPASIVAGTTTNVTLIGLSDGDTGFFDPGNGFSNRIAAAVNGGGVTVNSITYNNPTNLTLNVSVAFGATTGARTMTVTNPDNQSATSVTAILTILSNGSTNVAPVLAAIANQTNFETVTLTFTEPATDANGDTLTFSLDPGAPGNATIDSATGVFTWTPTEAQGPATSNITVRVTDNGSPPLSDTKTFSVTVLESNLPPVLNAISNRTIFELTTLTLTNTASDSDIPANTVTFSFVSGAPTNATLNSSNGIFSWTPSESQGPSTNTISIKVADNSLPSLSATQTFIVTVLETNSAPTLSVISNRIIFELTTLTFTNTAMDSDVAANTLTFHFASAPTNATLDSSSGVFSWTPNEAQGPSTNVISIKVSDDGSPSLSATQTFTVTVLETNSAPMLAAISNQTIFELETLTFTNMATDPDMPTNTLTFSFASGTPTNATLNSSNGVFAWTPTEAQGPGTNVISIKVSDGGSPSLSATQTFTVVVLETNSAPTLASISDRTLFENETLLVTNFANDADIPANTLTFALENAPVGASINSSNGVFTWTPDETQGATTNAIFIVVTDNGSPSLSATQAFTVTVLETNSAPVLAGISDQVLNEGGTLMITNSAIDSDFPPNVLTYSLDAGAPTNATINPTNGLLTWTPTEGQAPGTNSITVRVTDNGSPALSDMKTFTVIVNEVNAPPSLAAIPDFTIFETTTLAFTNVVSDPDIPANTFVFSLDTTPPPGVSLDTNTGAFSWTPTEAQGGMTNLFTIRVADFNRSAVNTQHLSDVKTFTVVVLESNAPPVLAPIANRTIHAGTTLVITNSAADSDLPTNTLAFSLDSGAPGTSSLDPVTGIFSWTPDNTYASTTNPITVRVTDDGAPPKSDAKTFSVMVVIAPVIEAISISSNTATITWSAITGQSYRLQYKSDLGETNWNDILPDVTASGSTASKDDPLDSNPQRYYRILVR